MFRYNITSEFLGVTLSARLAFSKRSWPFVEAVAIPWLVCSGQRCMSRLSFLGTHRRSMSAYYRFLSDGKWRLEVLFRSLFDLIVRTFHVESLTLVLDDTLCPKWGQKIFGTGRFFDHVRRPRPGFIWGHDWVVLAVVVRIGSVGVAALPFWVSLYRQKESCERGQFQTRHQLATFVLERVRSWFPGRIRLVADGAYTNQSLVVPAMTQGITVISRLRSDAKLRKLAPKRSAKSQRGRKPMLGAWLAKPPSLARERSKFTKHGVEIYGKKVQLNLREVVAWWPPLKCAIKLVITRDPRGKRRNAYLMTTDLGMSAIEVVETFAQRWSIEQLFSVAKNQLGLDSAEVRKERSVLRHAALCMALATWTEVWAKRFRPSLQARSFATKLSALRAETIAQTIFTSGPRRKGSRRYAKGLAALFSTATRAA